MGVGLLDSNGVVDTSLCRAFLLSVAIASKIILSCICCDVKDTATSRAFSIPNCWKLNYLGN